MAPAFSKLASISKLAASKAAGLNVKEVLIIAGIVASTASLWKALAWGKRSQNRKKDLQIPVENKEKKASLDGDFVRQVYRIMKILIPGAFCKETMYCVLIALSLMARTYCDVWMLNMTASIERTIIARELGDFKSHIGEYIKAMPLIAIVTQSLKYGISELKLRFRTNLTLKLQEQYLSDMVYYKINNLDSRIANPDQLLTQDIDKFCECVVDLYSNLTKPVLDIFLYVRSLITKVGIKTPALMIAYIIMLGVFVKRLRKPITRMTAEGQKLEGDFRHVNSRVITNSEEIAFYQGDAREKKTATNTFMKLVNHIRDVITFSFSTGIVENVVAKYFATVVAFFSIAISFFGDMERHRDMKNFEIMQDYYETSNIMIRMAMAIGRLAMSTRDVNMLAGYTSRVTLLMDVMKDMKNEKYERKQVDKGTEKEKEDSGTEPTLTITTLDMTSRSEIIKKDHVIKFENVPLLTPNGEVLSNEMSFEVVAGRNVLVCGPNGCGKSSLFRILGGLWPSFGGSITKPAGGKLFYVPQRPYMTIGSLRDQIIYPDTIGHMKMKGFSDTDLEDFLNKVHLGYILEREGGWDSIQDWLDVLSGGEKQRVAMARLFYHKPQFAILDECTSAVSVDVEGNMYSHCKEVGITLFTVSHRKSLWKYHEFVLYMDGRGEYEFKPIEEESTVE